MKKVDSDALGVVTKALGLSGAGSPITEFADGVVDQTLDVGQIVRRGRTQEPNQGIYTATLTNIHAGGGTLTSDAFPFAMLGGVGVIAPYPDPLPAGFDLWLLTASMRQASGGGTVTGAVFINYAIAQQGWGLNDAGAAVVGLSSIVACYWNALVAAGTTFGVQGNAGMTTWKLGMRLPRNIGTQLLYSTVASEAATFICDLVLGVFPVALGQDGLV